MSLNDFKVKEFLENDWQKTPKLIPKAFALTDWLSPDELAGLACEEDVESRIILQEKGRWDVEHGPFPETRFSSLPKSNWTLLVQGVDQWVPEVAEILRSFDFLPSWRLDDIMVSYAPVGGTVSQHYDFFDVFLIQGEGSRVWQIGEKCNSQSEYLPNTPVRILKDFTPFMEVTLHPGDILYIPAKYAHYGVSVEDSLTYSVGFRAPSIRDIVDGVTTSALEHLTEDQRYMDSIATLAAKRSEISLESVNQVKVMLLEALSDERLLSSWLGNYVTERKYPDQENRSCSLDDYFHRLSSGDILMRHPASRFAYINHTLNHSSESASLFVDGQEYKSSLRLAEYLANQHELANEALLTCIETQEDKDLVENLFSAGAIVFEDEFYAEDEFGED